MTELTFFLAYFIEALICFYYLNAIFDQKKSVSTICISFLLSFFTQTYLAFLFQNPVINNITFFTCLYFITYVCYQSDTLARIFHIILLTVLMNFSELVAIGTLSLVSSEFNPNTMQYPVTFIYLIISKLFLYIFVICITYFFIRKKLPMYHNLTFYILLLIPILSETISLTMASMCSFWNLDSQTSFFIFITLLCLILLNIVFVFTFYYMQNRHTEYLEVQLKLQLQSDEQNYSYLLSQQDEQQRILIHDIKNHLHTIQLLAKDISNADTIRNYINELNLSTQPVLSGNHNLDLILNRYKLMCKEKDISFQIEVQNSDISFLSLPEITALFCNLLDNALEAATKSSDPFINLRITNKSEVSLSVISLVNSCVSQPKVDQNGFIVSSKKNAEEHGFGLRSIQKILTAHNGTMNTYYDKNNHTFHSIITMEHKGT